MISKNIAQLYARDSRVAVEIAERDILLTYALKLLEENGWLNRIVFKGGTCLRKFYAGKLMRFSMDLDFTCVKKESPDDLILEMADIFNREYYGIQFTLSPKDFYVRDDRLSCGAAVHYVHSFHQAGFDIELSLREPVLMKPVGNPPMKTSYLRYLERPLGPVPCLDLLELQAEKIRASYQRLRSRDVYDLALLADRPFDEKLLRLLAVLKFWHVRSEFDPAAYLERLESRAYDWDDLRRLVRKDEMIDPKRLIQKCVRGYRFLASLSAEERKILSDAKFHRETSWVKKIEEKLGR